MLTGILFEHRWHVDEGALRRTRWAWTGLGLVLAVLGSAVMVPFTLVSDQVWLPHTATVTAAYP